MPHKCEVYLLSLCENHDCSRNSTPRSIFIICFIARKHPRDTLRTHPTPSHGKPRESLGPQGNDYWLVKRGYWLRCATVYHRPPRGTESGLRLSMHNPTTPITERRGGAREKFRMSPAEKQVCFLRVRHKSCTPDVLFYIGHNLDS